MVLREILIRRLLRDWINKANKWTVKTWRSYQREMYEKFVRTKYTRAILDNPPSFDELIHVSTPDYPEPPPNYPTMLEWYSTGTIRSKRIALSRNDLLIILRTAARVLGNIGKFPAKNVIGVATDDPYASARFLFGGASIIGKKHISLKYKEIDERLPEIKKKAPYDTMLSMISLAFGTLRKFKEHNIPLEEPFVLGVTGDILTKSLRNRFQALIEELGVTDGHVHQFYACSEGGVMGASTPNTDNLVYYPDGTIMFLRNDQGEVYHMFDAPQGFVGEVLVTFLKEMIVPNFELKDVVEIVKTRGDFGMPEYRVLGRKAVIKEFDVPFVGRVKGMAGAILRVAGLHLTSSDVVDTIERLGGISLTVIFDRGNEAEFHIYSERPIDERTLIEELLKTPETKTTGLLIKDGIYKIENHVVPNIGDKIADYLKEKIKEGKPQKLFKLILVKENLEN